MLERFEILKTIGNGATSEVFQARRAEDAHVVALKRFHSALLGDPEQLQRLRSEVEVLKILKHPNVVGLQGEHFENGQYWLEIDFVDGCDLRQWLRDYRLPLMEPRLFALVQIARGLGHAHEQSVIHRDLKPENILVAQDGQIRITDFGLARSLERMTMTRLGLLVGSLGYMAPEVINGGKATMKSDLFSFGVLAYEVLTGVAPFTGDSPQVLIRAICEGRYRPLKDVGGRIPGAVAEIIDACLSGDPEVRPASIWAVEAVLMNHLVNTGIVGLCKDLIARSPDASVLQEALRRKHVILQKQAEETPAEQRRELLHLASEIRELFPEDAMLPRIFARISANPRTNNRRRWAAAVLTLLILTGAAFFLRHPPKPAETAPPPAPTGYIRFDIDPSVEIRVDGETVPAGERLHFARPPGLHQIYMSKDGFDPIQSQIEVLAGETAVVRAGGE